MNRQGSDKHKIAVDNHDNDHDHHDSDDSTASMDDDMEDMFIQGPAGIEWGGPTRGGKRPEPTRYGDWERKGRCSDF